MSSAVLTAAMMQSLLAHSTFCNSTLHHTAAAERAGYPQFAYCNAAQHSYIRHAVLQQQRPHDTNDMQQEIINAKVSQHSEPQATLINTEHNMGINTRAQALLACTLAHATASQLSPCVGRPTLGTHDCCCCRCCRHAAAATSAAYVLLIHKFANTCSRHITACTSNTHA